MASTRTDAAPELPSSLTVRRMNGLRFGAEEAPAVAPPSDPPARPSPGPSSSWSHGHKERVASCPVQCPLVSQHWPRRAAVVVEAGRDDLLGPFGSCGGRLLCSPPPAA